MSDQTAAGAARIAKTKRVEHVITQADLDATEIDLDAVWDTPFLDLNYTVTLSVEVVSPADPAGFNLAGFTKAVDKITAPIGVSGTPGAVIILHAHGLHD